MTHCCYEVNQCSEVSPISPFWLKNLHDIHVLARSGPMEIAIFHGFVQAKLTHPNAMGQIFYSRFFKTLDQMGSDGQPFWLK